MFERAMDWWSGLDERVQLAFYDDLGAIDGEVDGETLLELRDLEPHRLSMLSDDLQALVEAALEALVGIGSAREWFEAEYGATSGPLAAFLDEVEAHQGKKVSGLNYIGGSHSCDFTGEWSDGYDDVRRRGGEALEGRGYAALCCLYPEEGADPLYCTLQVALPDGNGPIWLVEPSGSPERVAADLDSFVAALAPADD